MFWYIQECEMIEQLSIPVILAAPSNESIMEAFAFGGLSKS